MQFEVLLNVYLTWQLLLRQVFGWLRHLDHALCFCSGCGVEGKFISARWVGQDFITCPRHHIGCEGLHWQIGRDRGVGQGWARAGSCRECNNYEGRADRVIRIEEERDVSMLLFMHFDNTFWSGSSVSSVTFWLHLSIYITHMI